MKKTIFYVLAIIIVAVLLVLGFKTPRTTKNTSEPLTASNQKKSTKLDAQAEDGIFGFNNNKEDLPQEEDSGLPFDRKEDVNKAPVPPPVSPAELNSTLAGFPLYEKAELSFDAYRAFRKNNLVDLKEWNESQIENTPALQVIGNGARAYFKVDLAHAKDLLEYYSNSNINTNGWRYEGSFKEDVVNHKPEFKDNALYAGDEKIEQGKHIAYALSKDKHFGTLTIFQPRFDDGFLVMFVDVTKE